MEALSVSSGMAAIHYSLINIVEMGHNIVSLPQLYGATYTLLAHILPKQGIARRFAESDCPEAVEKLIDENTRAVYCESVGNPAGNVADIEGLARVAHKHGVPLIVDNTVATPVLFRPIEYGADVVVHSMTKFMGGHGTTLGGMIVDSGKFPWRDHPQRYYMLNQPEIAYHGVVYTEQYGPTAYVARCRTVVSAIQVPHCHPLTVSCCCRGSRQWRFAWSATWRMRGKWRSISAIRPGRMGELRRISG